MFSKVLLPFSALHLLEHRLRLPTWDTVLEFDQLSISFTEVFFFFFEIVVFLRFYCFFLVASNLQPFWRSSGIWKSFSLLGRGERCHCARKSNVFSRLPIGTADSRFYSRTVGLSSLIVLFLKCLLFFSFEGRNCLSCQNRICSFSL